MRGKIWTTLCNVKFKSFILSMLVDKFQKRERNINIFLAVASSTSIAAWAVWNVYPFLWSGIIALSQILTLIKPYIPYFKYVKELNEKLLRAENMNLELEKLWYKLDNKKISDDDAATDYFELKKQITEIFSFGDDNIFSADNNKMKDKANEKMKIFLRTEYNTEIKITK